MVFSFDDSYGLKSSWTGGLGPTNICTYFVF